MLITQTPFRISFFGGGTDYPEWYKEHGGSTLVSTIDRYCYLTCRYLPPFFEHRHRVVYTNTELVDEVSQIKHPAVKGVLSHLGIEKGVEIIHYGDLPARAGLGSSSAFTVGLLNAFSHIEKQTLTKEELALKALHIEQNVMKEVVGSQDQIAAVYGGINRITFRQDGTFDVKSLNIPQERIQRLENCLYIVFTGIQRNAPDIARSQVENLKFHKQELFQLMKLVTDGENILSSSADLNDFGKLLHEGWKLKRSLSNKISNNQIDAIYEKGLSEGSLGGKLLGAGGGGFLLFYVPEEKQSNFLTRMKDFIICPVVFEFQGSRVISMGPGRPEVI